MEIPKTCNCQNCELKPLFFDSIKEEDLTPICNSKHEQSFSKGTLICTEGEAIKEFMYLKSGLVKIHKIENEHRDQIIKIAKPLDYVNLLSIFSDSIYHYSVTAIEDSVVCYVDLEVIKSLVHTNGSFALSMIQKMNHTTDAIIQTVLEISKKNLRGRIAYVLLYFADQIYFSDTYELPLARKEIAEFIEMTTENVIRILSEFRKDGILKINGKIIEISNRSRLQQIMEHG
jgi:CRP-like cAMP-binding protein